MTSSIASVTLSILALLACSDTTQLDLTELKSDESASVQGNPVRILLIEPAPVGSRIALGCADGSVRIVDVRSGVVVRTLLCGAGGPGVLRWSRQARRLLVGTQEYESDPTGHWSWTVFDLEADSPDIRIPLPDGVGGTGGGGFSADEQRVIVWSDRSGAAVYDSATRKKLFDLATPGTSITCAGWAERTDQIVGGCADGSIRLWKASTGEPQSRSSAVGSSTNCLAVSPDGSRLFVGSTPRTGTIWKLPSLQQATPSFQATGWDLLEDAIADAQWSPDGERIVFTTSPWHTMECRSKTGELLWLHDFTGGFEVPLGGSFDPSGNYVFCRRRSGDVLDSGTGEKCLDLGDWSAWRDLLAWTADGRFLAYSGSDGLEVRDVPSFRLLRRLRFPTSGVVSTSAFR